MRPFAAGTLLGGAQRSAGWRPWLGGGEASAARSSCSRAAAWRHGAHRSCRRFAARFPSLAPRPALALAAGLYGFLLGLGFTTFVFTFAVWALAGVPSRSAIPARAAIGLGFGAGRALPVVALAPRGGGDAHAAMAERPRILRALRVADAVALAACAAALLAAPAQAATVVVKPATDPSVDAATLAFQQPGAGGFLLTGVTRAAAPGAHPAVGGGRLAYAGNGTIEVRAPADPAFAVSIPAAADAIAVNAGWVAWRTREPTGDALWASPLAAPAPRRVLGVSDPLQLGRPALAGDELLFHVAGASATRIEGISLVTGARRTLRKQRRAQLLNPSVLGDRLLYVRATYPRQQLRLGLLQPQSPEARPQPVRDRPHRPPRRGLRARRGAPQARPPAQAPAAPEARRRRHPVEHGAERALRVRHPAAAGRRQAGEGRAAPRGALALRSAGAGGVGCWRGLPQRPGLVRGRV